ncbi:hypothetical protein PG994_009974 [Apiospora phragmitis]|uniref:Myb-like domain-containing protein n=1 Tax=Apiospora phragmitis TaxID=2905665 RepID=A0ABR1TR61_9PEZI
MVARPPFVQDTGTSVPTQSDFNFPSDSPESWNSVSIDGSCAGFGVLLKEIAQQSQGCEPMTYSMETPVSEFEIRDSTDPTGQQFYPQLETKGTDSGPFHTSRASLEPLSTHISPREVTSPESQPPVSNLATASMVRLSPINEDGTSCSNTDVEDDQSVGNYTDSDREIPVPSPENTADDSADSNVASILPTPDSTASAVLTAVVEEPVAAILSADTNQTGKIDRSSPASGQDTQALASHTTAVHNLGLRSRWRERSFQTLPSADGMPKMLKTRVQAPITSLYYGRLAARTPPSANGQCGNVARKSYRLIGRRNKQGHAPATYRLCFEISSISPIKAAPLHRIVAPSSWNMTTRWMPLSSHGGATEVSSDDEGASSTDDSDSQSDGAESDATSRALLNEEKQTKRRRWKNLEECRLRAWVKEGQDWRWIANKLHRSEAAVTQHWTIMTQKDCRDKKKT